MVWVDTSVCKKNNDGVLLQQLQSGLFKQGVEGSVNDEVTDFDAYAAEDIIHDPRAQANLAVQRFSDFVFYSCYPVGGERYGTLDVADVQ